MKLLSDWGITTNWWRGDRGEYWVIAQGILPEVLNVKSHLP